MSLLIKALDKAQAEKAQAKGSAENKSIDKSKKRTKAEGEQTSKPAVKQSEEAALSLSPPEEAIAAGVKGKSEELPKALQGTAADALQNEAQHKSLEIPPLASTKKIETESEMMLTKEPSTKTQAANVFAAKRIEPTHQTAKLAIIVGLVALLIMAGLFYWYQKFINVPDIVIPTRPPVVVSSQEMPEPLPEVSTTDEEGALVDEQVEIVIPFEPDESEEEIKPAVTAQKEETVQTVFSPKEDLPDVEETLATNEEVVGVSVSDTPSIVTSASVGIASESASISVTQAKTASGVNPTLMRAYEAYNAGNDSQAQQDYKLVLQRYGANVDAMLGLGAIATRQGRLADANGWYRKVLEVEPRNEAANAGLLSIQQEGQLQNNESAIKSMLVSAPEDANLHAALGDVYASRGQWSAAQQAYFDAYRLNPNGENAFNLGVSLDQLGKPKLALPYYQEALQKAEQSSVIDVAALEARILSIQ